MVGKHLEQEGRGVCTLPAKGGQGRAPGLGRAAVVQRSRGQALPVGVGELRQALSRAAWAALAQETGREVAGQWAAQELLALALQPAVPVGALGARLAVGSRQAASPSLLP